MTLHDQRVRALAIVVVAGCATSTDVGVLQRGIGDGMGGSLTGHMGIGAVQDKILALDLSVRGDVAQGGSRIGFGASVLGGLPIGRFRALARVGVWRAAVSSSQERDAVPTFELAGYIPLRESDDPASKYGWSASGVIVGVREDLDVAAYTTIFVGLQLFLIPGY